MFMHLDYICNLIALKHDHSVMRTNTTPGLMTGRKKTWRNLLVLTAVMGAMTACKKDDPDPPAPPATSDTTPPAIVFADGRSTFRPDHGEVRSTTATHMHVRLKAQDSGGLAEVNVSVSGTYIGTVPSQFTLLGINDVYSPSATNEVFRFTSGATSLNIDGESTDIYWFGPEARPEVTAAVLAGPYQFTAWARDMAGNVTPEAQRPIHQFYISRQYAPAITITNLEDDEIEGEEGEPLEVEGTIAKGTTELAGDLAFLWVRLVATDTHDDFAPAAPIAESVWGQSKRITASGQSLPSTGSIDLSVALSGADAIVLPDGHGHYDLIIWAEDVHGNVSRQAFEVHAH